MPYAMFHARFSEVAKRETRTVTVTSETRWGPPPGDYTFLEMYCDEPGCDCRRVFFNVVSSSIRETVAVIAYGWEGEDYYAKWMGDDDPLSLRELKGPILNLSSPQSRSAPALLDLFENVLLKDQHYIERIERHYRMFRDAIDGKAKAHRRSRKGPSKG